MRSCLDVMLIDFLLLFVVVFLVSLFCRFVLLPVAIECRAGESLSLVVFVMAFCCDIRCFLCPFLVCGCILDFLV